MPLDKPISSLEELFAEARPSTVRAFKTKDKTLTVEPSRDYLDPSAWRAGQVVALVHADSDTVLGAFQEWLHSTGARKLVRIESVAIISRTERVEGSWWLGEERRPEPRKEWHEQRTIVMHLHLEKLGIHAPATELVVHLAFGGIARVELAQDTLFAAESGAALWTLAAGTNLLEVMGLDAKINVRKECGL